MKGKTFAFTVLFTGIGTMLFAQPAIVITPSVMPDGHYGSAYKNQTLKVTGGAPRYSFSISSGELPSGMTLSPDGVLSGTPTAAGKYAFRVKAESGGPGDGGGKGKGKGHDPGPPSVSQDYSLNVNPATLTITADNKTMPLGGPLPALTASYKGFVNHDNVSSLATPPSITTTATSASPAGSYPITVSSAVDPNYVFVYVAGTLAIDEATVQVTADAVTKEYGAPDPVLTYSVSGLPPGVGSNVFTGTLSRSPGENVGTYPISIGTLSAGTNYRIKFTGSNLTITKASQQIAWSQTLSVGCSGTTQVQLTATASSGLPVLYSVSDNNVATVSGNVLTLLNPGTALVTAGQAGDANYNAAAAVIDTLVFQPESLIIQHWNDAIIFDNSSRDFVAWQWYKDDVAVTGDTSAYYSEDSSLNGQYFVIATNKEGQQIQSCTLTVTPGAAAAGGIKVFPNPAGRGAIVTVLSNYDETSLQGAILQIADLSGRVLQQITAVQPSMQVTLPAAGGIYILNLLLPNGQRVSTNALVGQ